MINKCVVIFLVNFVWFSSLQSQTIVNVITSSRAKNDYLNSNSIISIKRNITNPFISLEEVLFKAIMDDRLVLYDLGNKIINSEDLQEMISVIDTIEFHDHTGLEKTIEYRYNKTIASFGNIDGYELDLSLEMKNDELSAILNFVRPIIRLKEKSPKLYCQIKPNSVCEEPDFGYLVRSIFDQNENELVRDYLFDVLDRKKDVSVYNSNFRAIGDVEMQQIMIAVDTIHTVSYDTYSEEVNLYKTEILKEDLEITLLGEFVYCSDLNSFSYIPKAIGLSAKIISNEVGIEKKRVLFYIKVE